MKWSTLLCEKRQREHIAPHYENDLRNEFQRDYHRIIGSASFRRLQDKTQVFALDKSDFVRTRLTHSLEVSSFAKSMGQTIFNYIEKNQIDNEINHETRSKICSILECAGLVHDIGNPPFGHFGELFLRDYFIENLPLIEYKGKKLSDILTQQQIADLTNFEGNAQALRLLTKLHFLIDEHGMNLTYALLNTIIKYPISSTEIQKNSSDIRYKKAGYYASEKDLFNDITSSTGAGNNRYPLTFILEAADDIAYKTADIEDSIKKGCFSVRQLINELKSNRYIDLIKDSKEKELYFEIIADLEDKLKISEKKNIPDPEQNGVQNWLISIQGIFISKASKCYIENYDKIMSGEFNKALLDNTDVKTLAYALSDIAYRLVFRGYIIIRNELSAGTVLEYLMNAFMSAVLKFDSDERLTCSEENFIDIISENYKSVYKTSTQNMNDEEKIYYKLLLLTDHICGMTDGYAELLYRQLNCIK